MVESNSSNLGHVRDLFVQATGRYDLVNEDGTDNGANRLINMGARMLDDMSRHNKSIERHIIYISTGCTRAEVRWCRAIKEVWLLQDSGESRTRLEKKTLEQFWEDYPDHFYYRQTDNDPPFQTNNTAGSGTPLYYAINVEGLNPTQNYTDALKFAQNVDRFSYGAEDVVAPDHFATRSILIAPTPDEAMALDIRGYFYSAILDKDQDMNYWTMVYPDLLVLAADYKVESLLNRNTEGMKDKLAAIQQIVTGVWHNLVEEEQTDESQLRG